jgi:hypothetical protein
LEKALPEILRCLGSRIPEKSSLPDIYNLPAFEAVWCPNFATFQSEFGSCIFHFKWPSTSLTATWCISGIAWDLGRTSLNLRLYAAVSSYNFAKLSALSRTMKIPPVAPNVTSCPASRTGRNHLLCVNNVATCLLPNHYSMALF